MAYSEKVIDHYENPRNVGSMDKKDNSVGTGMVGAPACGCLLYTSNIVRKLITQHGVLCGIGACLRVVLYLH